MRTSILQNQIDTAGVASGKPAATAASHIAVCICTYQRPQMLRRLLQELDIQETGGLFTYSIVIVDNDRLQTGKTVAMEFAATASIAVSYDVEPRPNIAHARNKAVENAKGEFVAFIDDDEVPAQQWLLTLYRTCREYGVDGVLGPVKPSFDESAPAWVVEGRFYDRASYPTGFVIDGAQGRTGNVLLKKSIFQSCSESHMQPFRPEFRTGEDQDFFRRMIERKHVFIWCNEAVAYEAVPPIRWQRRFMLRRALLRGECAVLHPRFGWRDAARSLLAVPAYMAALPVAFFLGQHRFMTVLISLFDHLGKLCALLGIHPITGQYITE